MEATRTFSLPAELCSYGHDADCEWETVVLPLHEPGGITFVGTPGPPSKRLQETNLQHTGNALNFARASRRHSLGGSYQPSSQQPAPLPATRPMPDRTHPRVALIQQSHQHEGYVSAPTSPASTQNEKTHSQLHGKTSGGERARSHSSVASKSRGGWQVLKSLTNEVLSITVSDVMSESSEFLAETFGRKRSSTASSGSLSSLSEDFIGTLSPRPAQARSVSPRPLSAAPSSPLVLRSGVWAEEVAFPRGLHKHNGMLVPPHMQG